MRRSSLEAYIKIKENNLLSERRWQVYDALFEYGPCTANELAKKAELSNKWPRNINMNVVTRLGELRDRTVAYEVREDKPCSVTGNNVIEWDVTENLPIKFDKPKKYKCKACNGKGYIEEKQAKLF